MYFDTPYDFFGFAYPVLDWGTFAFGLARIASGDIVMRDETSRIIPGGGGLDLREYIFGFSREVVYNISAGVNFKIDQQRLVGDTSTGVGMDAGLMYAVPRTFTAPENKAWDQLSLGVTLQNALGSHLRLKDETDVLPLELRAGLAYRYETRDRMKQSFLLSADFEKSTWRSPRLLVGLEYSLFQMLALRGGWNAGGWSAGGGLQYQGFLFDYALSGEELGFTHRFTLTWRYGTPIADQRRENEKKRQEELDREAERRARLAVEKARRAVENTAKEAMRASERKHQREQDELRASLTAQADQKLAEERQRQDQERTNAVASEYFKALHYFQGVKDYLANNFKEAVVEFETVAKYDSHYLELPVYLSKARQRLKGGVQFKPQDLELYYKGIDLYVEERFEDAIAVWKQILAHEPDNVLAQRNIQEAQDRIAKIKALEKVIQNEVSEEPAKPAPGPTATPK
jgi:hypothetical protein